MWLIVVYFMYAKKGKANHNTKKEDSDTTKERNSPCTVVLHSSNEKQDIKQYPVAYYTMLKNTGKTAGVAILAVETGPTSDTILSKSMKAKFSIMEADGVDFATEIMVMDCNVNNLVNTIAIVSNDVNGTKLTYCLEMTATANTTTHSTAAATIKDKTKKIPILHPKDDTPKITMSVLHSNSNPTTMPFNFKKRNKTNYSK
eukprot:12829721-Ditylum_brightwellii.AAC.1